MILLIDVGSEGKRSISLMKQMTWVMESPMINEVGGKRGQGAKVSVCLDNAEDAQLTLHRGLCRRAEARRLLKTRPRETPRSSDHSFFQQPTAVIYCCRVNE